MTGQEAAAAGGPVGGVDFDGGLRLLASLMEANARDSAWTVNRLLTGVQRDLAERDAELRLIRVRVERLLSGDFMPTANAFRRALNPSREDVLALAEPNYWPDNMLTSD